VAVANGQVDTMKVMTSSQLLVCMRKRQGQWERICRVWRLDRWKCKVLEITGGRCRAYRCKGA